MSPSKLNRQMHINEYQSLIEFINTLQRINTFIGLNGTIDLPQIVVIGSQSSGKSSVLEGLVGRTFLPRGTGIVTKCPIIIQIVNNSNEKSSSSKDVSSSSLALTYIQFLDEGGNDARKYTDFDEVRTKIERLSEARLNSPPGCAKKVISDVPIIIKVSSPDLVTLTVVDLPGVAKLHKDDPEIDIELETRKLINSYISQPNCLILAVTAMSEDICNSEALLLAKRVDPNGNKTLGVLTKIDLMDAGTNAVEYLSGTIKPIVPVQMVGIINRSQLDIQNNKSIEDAIRDEQKFFNESPTYKHLAATNGTNYLRKVINERLIEHIREFMPQLEVQLRQQKLKCVTELTKLGGNDTINKSDYVLHAIHKFVRHFHTEIEGSKRDTEIFRKYGGSKIKTIFLTKFQSDLTKIEPTKDITNETIETAIENSGGFETMFFLPEIAFKVFTQKQIKQFREPSSNCATLVYQEMLEIVNNCLKDNFFRFPSFNNAIKEIMTQLLNERLDKAKEYLEHYITTLSTVILTSDSNFRKEINDVFKNTDAISSYSMFDEKVRKNAAAASKESLNDMIIPVTNGNSSAEKSAESVPAISIDVVSNSSSSATKLPDKQYEIVRNLVKSYYDIIIKRVRDHVPASIGESLILYYDSEALSVELTKRLHQPSKIDSLVQVPLEDAQQRQRLNAWNLELEEAEKNLTKYAAGRVIRR